MTKKDTDLLYHEKTNKREVVNINGNSVSTGGLVGVQRGLRQTDQSRSVPRIKRIINLRLMNVSETSLDMMV